MNRDKRYLVTQFQTPSIFLCGMVKHPRIFSILLRGIIHTLKHTAAWYYPEYPTSRRVNEKKWLVEISGGKLVVADVVVEASAPKVYPRVTLASASTLSGSVVRTLRGGEGLPNMFAQLHRAWGTSVANVRSFEAPLCKGDTGGLRKGRGDWRRLSAMECGRLSGAQGGPFPLGC